MTINKISFGNVERTQKFTENKKEDVKKERSVQDTEKSNAAKYMIGAVALAGAIAVGIVGHKNNWWRKAEDACNDLTNKVNDTANSALLAGSKDVGIKRTGSVAIEVPKVNIEILDFSNLKGEKIRRDNGMYVISQKNESGAIVREFFSLDNKITSVVCDYDPGTGKKIKEISYFPNGQTSSIKLYDSSTGKNIKRTYYYANGTTKEVYYYNPSTGESMKSISYYLNGNIDSITDYDASGNHIKTICYFQNGRGIRYVVDYDPNTGRQIKFSSYCQDGTIGHVVYMDPATGKYIKSSHYAPKDHTTIESVTGHDSSTEPYKYKNSWSRIGAAVKKTLKSIYLKFSS